MRDSIHARDVQQYFDHVIAQESMMDIKDSQEYRGIAAVNVFPGFTVIVI